MITSTNAASQQFNIVVLTISGAGTGLNIGAPATVQYSTSPPTPFDIDFLHADNLQVSTSSFTSAFTGPADLVRGPAGFDPAKQFVGRARLIGGPCAAAVVANYRDRAVGGRAKYYAWEPAISVFRARRRHADSGANFRNSRRLFTLRLAARSTLPRIFLAIWFRCAARCSIPAAQRVPWSRPKSY